MKNKLIIGIITVFIFASAVSTVGARQFEVGVAEKSGSSSMVQVGDASVNRETPSASASALIAADNRSTLETFLFGPSEKNLKAVKTELIVTNSNLAQLKSLLSITMDDAGIVGLNAQINDLEFKKALLEEHIATQEKTFSVLGWFKKLFTK
ncbi:MAG: hypothetical protein WC467_02310 [Patescibacteria group bacterium]